MKKNKTVLVIEDDKALQKAIVKKLEKKGFQVFSAETAEDGLVALRERPELIWLDFYLPGMNGNDFLNKMDLSVEYREIPVIVVTCSGGDKTRNELLSHQQVSGYFLKNDIQLETIVHTVENLVQKK